jgi:hypothetical protein
MWERPVKMAQTGNQFIHMRRTCKANIQTWSSCMVESWTLAGKHPPPSPAPAPIPGPHHTTDSAQYSMYVYKYCPAYTAICMPAWLPTCFCKFPAIAANVADSDPLVDRAGFGPPLSKGILLLRQASAAPILVADSEYQHIIWSSDSGCLVLGVLHAVFFVLDGEPVSRHP